MYNDITIVNNNKRLLIYRYHFIVCNVNNTDYILSLYHLMHKKQKNVKVVKQVIRH